MSPKALGLMMSDPLGGIVVQRCHAAKHPFDSLTSLDLRILLTLL